MNTKRTLKNLAALLLLVGIFSTCTNEEIAVTQIEDNAELVTRQHIDMSELHNYYVRGFSVELRLKPQTLSRNSSYSTVANTKIQTLLSNHNAILRPSFPDTRSPVLLQYYTLTIRENYMNTMSRSSEENKKRREAVIKELLAIGLFENYVREFGDPVFPLCVNPVSVNDPHFRDDHGWALRLIQAPCAWSITRGNPNVWIGIVDSDFDRFHIEFNNNKIAYINGPVTGRWYLHGTAVASIAAANTDNGVGIAGIGHNSRIAARRVVHYPIDHPTFGGMAHPDHIRDAINHLHNMRVPVINVSWARTGLSRAQAQDITQNGTTLVLAAGNRVSDRYHRYLADIPGVIVVSGVDRNNRHEPTHTARNQYVSIVAPSKGVKMAAPGNTHVVQRAYVEGTNIPRGSTSLAAPFVSGTIALMLSVNRTLTPAQIENVLRLTAVPIADGHLFPGQLGAGLLNAYAAVRVVRDATNVTLSGPQAIGIGSVGIFTLGSVPAGAHITWQHSPGLQHVTSSGNTATFRATNSTVCNGWVQAVINGIPSRRVDVVMNRPTIQSIEVREATTWGAQFIVHHTGGTTFSWSISPDHGVFMTGTTNRYFWNPVIRFPGHYRVTVTVSNACGVATMSRSIEVTGESPIIRYCIHCGTPNNFPPGCFRCPPPNMFREEEDEE